MSEMAGVASVNQKIACRMAYEDASGGHSYGKAAEGISGFDPAGGEARKVGGCWDGTRMRRRWRERRAPEVEHIERASPDHN